MRAGRILKGGGSGAGADSGQRPLEPHSCGASWRDKKLPAGGTQPMHGQGCPSKGRTNGYKNEHPQSHQPPGPMWASAPTKNNVRFQRRGRCPHRPVGCVSRAVRKIEHAYTVGSRADEGIGPDEKQRVSVSQRGDARVLWPYIHDNCMSKQIANKK